LLDVFTTEQYVLWFNPDSRTAFIILKDQATTISQLKAWSHALRMARTFSKAKMGKMDVNRQAIVKMLKDTQQTHNNTFDGHLKQLEDAGWNTSTAVLETTPGRRICVGEPKLSIHRDGE
jgi:hypothetical protein